MPRENEWEVQPKLRGENLRTKRTDWNYRLTLVCLRQPVTLQEICSQSPPSVRWVTAAGNNNKCFCRALWFYREDDLRLDIKSPYFIISDICAKLSIITTWLLDLWPKMCLYVFCCCFSSQWTWPFTFDQKQVLKQFLQVTGCKKFPQDTTLIRMWHESIQMDGQMWGQV